MIWFLINGEFVDAQLYTPRRSGERYVMQHLTRNSL